MLTFLDRDYLFRLILVLLLYSLIPLAEIFLFIYLASLIGNWLVLVLAAVAGIAGALAAGGELRRIRARYREQVRGGRAVGPEVVDLAGVTVAAILLITPGFISDVCGYLLLIPALRRAAGRALARRLKAGFRDLYDQLRLSTL